MANRSPEEAIGRIEKAGASPLSLVGGMRWALLHDYGSRLKKPGGTFDARTPALVAESARLVGVAYTSGRVQRPNPVE